MNTDLILNKNNNTCATSFKRRLALGILSAAALLPAHTLADSVGQVQTTKYFAPETVALLKQRAQDKANGVPGAVMGFQAGDTINYIIQFTPVANGGTVGAGGYITDYIPANTLVTNAQFVQPDGMGGFYQTAPPAPATMPDGWGKRATFAYTAGWTNDPYTLNQCALALKTTANCAGSLAQLVADTGIFYSTDPRTAVFVDPSTDGRVRQWAAPIGNGYNVSPGSGAGLVTLMGGPVGATPSTHNFWDAAMTNAFGTVPATALAILPPSAGNPAIVTSGKGAAPYNAASPVAGPDSGYQLDYTGQVGPWQRVYYPGSMVGSNAPGPALAIGTPTVTAMPTSAGASFPLPANTNALRWSAGRLTVGQLSYVKISLQLLAAPPASGLVNNSEVFGGDASADNGVGKGQDNPWTYAVMSVASNVSTLFAFKEVVCVYDATGTCVPNNGANLPTTGVPGPGPKVRYRLTYINTNNATQHNVTVCDQLPSNAVVVFATGVTQISASPNIGAPLSPAALACAFPVGGTTFSYPAIPVLAGGASGLIEFDVQYPALVANSVISNSLKVVSIEIPAGVTSFAPSNVVASTAANVSITKSVSPSAVAKGEMVTYSIIVANRGSTPANLTTLVDTLPGVAAVAPNLAINSRFNYVAGSTAITIGGTPVSGASPAMLVLAATNQEQVTVTFPAGTTIPAGGQLLMTFQATAGAALNNGMVYSAPAPALPTSYSNTAVINCASACVTTTGPKNTPVAPPALTTATGLTAPVVLTIPNLSITKTIDCVITAGVCTPGSYVAGSNIPANALLRYKILYSNLSTGAQTITLTDTLPASTTAAGNLYVANGPDIRPNTLPVANILTSNPAAAGAARGVDAALTLIPASSVVSFTPANLPGNSVGTLYMDVQTNVAAAGVVTNNASIQSTQRAAAAGLPVAAIPVSATASATSLTISKIANTANVAPGGVANYTITVRNTGLVAVTLTNIIDTLPLPSLGTILCSNVPIAPAAPLTTAADCQAGTTILNNGAAVVAPLPTQAAATAVLGQANTWALPAVTIAPNTNLTLTFNAAYSALVPRGTTHNNAASVTAAGSTFNTGPTAPVAVPYSSLSVTKAVLTPATASIAPNSPVTYQVTLTNTGTTPVPVTSVVDSLPTTPVGSLGTVTYTSTTSVVINTPPATVTPQTLAAVVAPALPTVANTYTVAATPAVAGTQQAVTWQFPAAAPVAPATAQTATAATPMVPVGGTMVITFVATYGAVPTATTYFNDVKVNYVGGQMASLTQQNLAPVTVPAISKITKTIDCVYVGLVCTPGSFVDGTPIPPAAKLGYKIVYENLAAVPMTGISVSDILPTQVVLVPNPISNLMINGVAAAIPVALANPTATVLMLALPAGPNNTRAAFGTPGAQGIITFDLQTNATTGVGVTNTASMSSTQDVTGASSSATAQVAGANITVSKAVTTGTSSTVAQGGTVSYTITARNDGAAPATLTSLVDTLPGGLPLAPAVALGTRFAYAATTAVSLNGVALVAPVPSVLNNALTNRDAVTWTFAATVIPVGQSVTLTFTATVGAAMPKGTAIAPNATYYNDVTANYTGGAFPSSSAGSQAPVIVPFYTLTMIKTIDCVYDAQAIPVCQPYVAGSPIPPAAKLRYKLAYSNLSPLAQLVTIKDTLPTSATAAGNLYVGSGPEVRPSVPALSVNAALAGAPRGADVLLTTPITPATPVAMTAVSLAGNGLPNSSGTLFIDVQTSALAGTSVLNCGSVSTVAGDTCATLGSLSMVSSTSSVNVANVAVLQITKTTSTPNVAPGGTATYTISIKNTGTAPTSALKIYDFLPFSGTVNDATRRFNFAVGSSVYGGGLTAAVSITTAVAPTIPPYASNINQQQVLWDFGAYALAAGATVTLTFNATVGAAISNTSYFNSARYEFSSGGIAYNGNLNNTALVNVTNPMPSLTFLKTVNVFSDPVNGVTNPKLIPGAVAVYSLTVTNSGTGAVDNNSLVITDPLPANTSIYAKDLAAAGSGPFAFSQGATPSGLTYIYNAATVSNPSTTAPFPDLQFFGGAPTAAWGYVPVPNAVDGCDPLVSQVRINPKGLFAGSPTAPSPSFTLQFRVCVK
ncbi:MAG: hypothetical protein PXX73_05970 [Sideroxydans sp.]|nr:hypothetical protein [Sideroxydans sp.]